MQQGVGLTERQQHVLTFFLETWGATGAPPTLRTIMARFGIKTPRGADVHLQALAKKGLLVHDKNRHPAYRPKQSDRGSSVPILGSAPAGNPSDQPEDHRGQLPLPWKFSDSAFAVAVTGESMRDAHVLEGDIVVVDPQRELVDGDIVLAMRGGESTIKTLRKTKGSFALEPANPAFKTQHPTEERDRVVGAVVALVRRTGS
jgi:repressor LexA